jgi:hypothetical protein
MRGTYRSFKDFDTQIVALTQLEPSASPAGGPARDADREAAGGDGGDEAPAANQDGGSGG